MRFKDIFTSGVMPEQSFSEKRDVIFLNQANFVLVFCLFSIFLANLFLGFSLRSIVSFCVIPFLVSTFFLQKKEYYFLAKVTTISATLLGSFLTTFLFGAEAKTQYYIFACYCLSMVVFHKRTEHLILSAIHLVLFSFLLIYLHNAPPIISGQDSTMISYFHFPMVFFCIFIVLSEYVVHNKRYEGRLNTLVSDLKENSELLEEEKVKFQMQREVLQVTNDRLINEIGHKEAKREELLESNESLEQFAYVASHDLKEPLRTIGSFSQLLKRKLEDKLDKETGEYFYFVIDGVQRMSKLLDDLLSFSRLNKQNETISVNLNDCIELNKLNLKTVIEKNKGQVIFNQMPLIKANRSQMNQLFQNLISNGLEFRSEIDPIIKVSCKEKTDHYLFSVEDSGIGIPKEFREKVFVIFQRLDNSAKGKGTGIGLAICKRIVENHGGEIWIESNAGSGSTFFFTLPKVGESQKIDQSNMEGEALETSVQELATID